MIVKTLTKKLILIWWLGVASATLVTYAQNEKPAPKQIAVAITLPADNVEITDTNDRKITATVLSSDANGITIRMDDRKEHQLPWNKLSTETIALITGTPVERKPKSPQERAMDYVSRVKMEKLPHETGITFNIRMEKESSEANKQIKDLSGKELQKEFLERNPFVMKAATAAELRWERDEHRYATYGDPRRIGFHTRPDYDYIQTLEIKSPDIEEIVSLREEFQKLGVKPTQQIGDTCAVYSVYHMLQHASLKEGGTPPSAARLYNAALQLSPSKIRGKPINHQYTLRAIEGVYGKRAHTMSLDMGIPKLTEEVLKQELRNGRPCRATVQYRKHRGFHDIVIIGFHTKDGITRYEYLDSNMVPTENNSGFMFMPNDYIAGTIRWELAYNMFSIRFK